MRFFVNIKAFAEVMVFGCVGVVLGSYLSVHDIIDNGVNGFVLLEPFDVEDFSKFIAD